MRRVVLIMLLALVVVSCKRRPLHYEYYPYADLTIEVDWTKAFSQSEKPTGVSVWFYPQDGGAPIQSYSANVDRHPVSVGVGTYDVVVFNMTPYELSSTIEFRGTDRLETLEVYSKHIATSRDPNAQRGLLTQEPEAFAVTVYRDLEVTEAMREDTWYVKYQQASSTVNRVVKVTPELANRRHAVRVRLHGFHNLSDNGVYAELSGLAEGYMIDTGKPNETNARQMLQGWSQARDEGEYSIGQTTVEYTTWGLTSEPTRLTDYDYWTGLIELAFKLVDNKTTEYFDVNLDHTNLKESSDGIHSSVELLIELGFDEDEKIVLPDVEPAEGGSSGFKPEVNPWDEEDIPLVVE